MLEFYITPNGVWDRVFCFLFWRLCTPFGICLTKVTHTSFSCLVVIKVSWHNIREYIYKFIV